MSEIGYERRVIASIKYARRFSGERIEYEELLSIVEMARWAPSIDNVQPWEVIIVDDPIEIKKLARLHPEGYAYERASALFFVVVDPNQSPYYLIDGGSLLSYIALASSIKGYSVLIVGLNDDLAFKSELGVPPLKYLVGLVAIGREAAPSASLVPRKPLEYIVYHDKYGLGR